MASDAGIATAQIFDPTTETWTTVEPMADPRIQGIAVTLEDGRVLVVGGQARNNVGALASAEIYTPARP